MQVQSKSPGRRELSGLFHAGNQIFERLAKP